MYHYVEDKQFLSMLRQECGQIMQGLCHRLKEQYDIGAQFYLVGSGEENLVMQNEDEPIDLDYNLKILRCDDINDCEQIKESVRKAFNYVLNMHGWGSCDDSKSCLTTKVWYYEKWDIGFSMDVAIVKEDEYGRIHRLIHQKTGDTHVDQWYWNIAPNSNRIKEKEEAIKDAGKWDALREEYRRIKNMYLKRSYFEDNHPSYICYVEAINNVYNSIPHMVPVGWFNR